MTSSTAAERGDGSLRLLSMLRLASPALPIGGYSYSQGLENAIERGWIHDAISAQAWILNVLELNIASFELPLLHRMHEAFEQGDVARLAGWNARFLASRETAELRAETLQMGWSLSRLFEADDNASFHAHATSDDISLPLAWVRAACTLGLSPAQSLSAWGWTWLENQVMAAMKAVPVGQAAGQSMLARACPAMARAIDAAPRLPESAWSNFSPGFAMAGSWHEEQYSRLFRS